MRIAILGSGGVGGYFGGRLAHAYLFLGDDAELLVEAAVSLACLVNCESPTERAANGRPFRSASPAPAAKNSSAQTGSSTHQKSTAPVRAGAPPTAGVESKG